MATATAVQLTGLSLRLLRTARQVSVTAVAREARVSRQRISAIESSDQPTGAAVERYLDALLRANAQ